MCNAEKILTLALQMYNFILVQHQREKELSHRWRTNQSRRIFSTPSSHLENGSSRVSYDFFKLYRQWANVTDILNLLRKTLHPVCEPSASIKSWCCPSQRDARSETHGTSGPREWNLPSQRGAFLPVLWRNYPSGNSQRARTWTPSSQSSWWNQNDNCRLPNTLSKVCH